ncbi:ATP-dependent RNA helicase DDX25 isoform X1 [Ciconia boyciana]|uniref:ATP-dependent RNA helicase DDX25 isoform X1 n=1 Tax=Ciconia boyciana TaxID=52775 RepID=UPI003BA13F70
MLDWCFKWRVIDVKKINMFVLDEADIMIDTQGLSYQSIRIQRALPKGCQMLLFSATFKETVRAFAVQIISNPIVIKLREEELTLSNIRQYFFVCRSREEKYRALCNIYGSVTIGQAMIFCQTRRSADWLSVEMSQDGHQVAILTAELTVAQRANVIQRFRDGKEKVLIATNVCARGIDVQQVTIVVNFSLPTDQNNQPDFETYLHRIGRTGRFGKKGIAFSMVESQNLGLVQMIEEHFRILSAFTLQIPVPGELVPRLGSALAVGEEPAAEITQVFPDRKSIGSRKRPRGFSRDLQDAVAEPVALQIPVPVFPVIFREKKVIETKNHIPSSALSSELLNCLGSLSFKFTNQTSPRQTLGRADTSQRVWRRFIFF